MYILIHFTVITVHCSLFMFWRAHWETDTRTHAHVSFSRNFYKNARFSYTIILAEHPLFIYRYASSLLNVDYTQVYDTRRDCISSCMSFSSSSSYPFYSMHCIRMLIFTVCFFFQFRRFVFFFYYSSNDFVGNVPSHKCNPWISYGLHVEKKNS